MKAKTKIIASSVLSMMLFGSVALGGTYALFNSTDTKNISVTAGKVELKAVIGDLNLYSPKLINLDGSIEDETNIASSSAFGNGGTASLAGNELTLSNIAPGDKLTTEIDIDNQSNIKTKYRFSLKAIEGDDLYHQLKIKINGEEMLPFACATRVESLDPATSPTNKVKLEISLPTTVDNQYAGLSTKLTLTVEGYQGNANVSDYDYALLSDDDFDLFKDYTKSMDFKDTIIKLGKDIDISGEAWDGLYEVNRDGLNKDAIDAGGFKGTFDGDGFSVKGLTMGDVDNAKDSVGFFNYVNGGTIKNIVFEDVSINTNSDTVGAAVGAMSNNAKIENIEIKSGNITGVEAGGVIGRAFTSGEIISCVNRASVTGTKSSGGAGGIVEKAYYSDNGKDLIIKDCTNYGKITASGYMGGISGLSCAYVDGCVNEGEIAYKGTGGCVGGIIGEQQNCGSINNCVNKGDFTTTVTHPTSGTLEPVGGIVGWIRYHGAGTDYAKKEFVELKNNINEADIKVGYCVGGIAGIVYNAVICDKNTNNGEIEAYYFAGGIIGNLTYSPSTTFDLGSTEDYSNQIKVTNNENTNNKISATGSVFKDEIVYNNISVSQITYSGNKTTLD